MIRVIIAVLILGVTLTAAADDRVVYTKRSLYQNILVTDEGDRLCLSFRLRNAAVHSRQSCMDKHDHDRLVFEYSRAVMAGLLVVPAPQRVLVIGLGGGSIPRVLRKVVPQARIEAVEIDPAVVQVAQDWFEFTPDSNVKIHVQDGRQFVKQAGLSKQGFDLIILDAFNSDYIPEHMMTREFLEECKRLLTSEGVLVANTFSTSRLYDSESATYAAVFGSFVNLKYDNGNRVILARRGTPPTLAQLRSALPAVQPRVAPFGVDLSRVLAVVQPKPDWDPKARVLTDAWSPANLMKGR